MKNGTFSRREQLGIALLLLWAVAACFLYFPHCWVPWKYIPAWFHLPYLDAPSLAERLDAWARLARGPLVAAAAVGVMLHWGGRLRRWIGVEVGDPALRVALHFALGALTLDLFWVGAGCCGLWRPGFVGLAALALAAPAVVGGIRFVAAGGVGRVGRLLSWREHGWAGNLLLGTGAAYLAIAFVHSLVPDLFYDSESYHLAFPALWMRLGGFAPVPGHLFAFYPFGGELVFMNGFWFGSDEAAKAVNVTVFAAAGMAFYGWAREEAGPRAAAQALGGLWTFAVLAQNVWNAQVEGLLTLLMTLCLWSLFRLGREQVPERWGPWFLTACVLGAGALSVKYLSAWYLGCFALCWVWTFGLGKEKRLPPNAWATAALCLALWVGPWMVRNWAWTGNPFAPYLSSWLGGDTLSSFGRERLLVEQHQFLAGTPWENLVWPVRAMTAMRDTAEFTGVFALILLPVAFFLRPPDDPWRLVFRVWWVTLVVGSFATQVLRFHAPVLALMFLLVPVFYARGGGRARGCTLAAFATTVSALLALPALANFSAVHYSPWGVVSGVEKRDAFLARAEKPPYAPFAEEAARVTEPDARLLVVGDARTLHYPRVAFAQSVFDRQKLVEWALEDPSPEALWRGLRRLGVDDVVVSGLEAARRGKDYALFGLSPEDWRRLDRAFRGAVIPVSFNKWGGVFRVREAFEPNPPVNPWEPRPFQLLSPPGAGFALAYEDGRWGEAERELDGLIRYFPDEGYWVLQRGRMRMRQGKRDAACDDLSAAARLGVDPPQAVEWRTQLGCGEGKRRSR